MSTHESENKKALTIPNLISFTRIVLITPFVVFFLDKEYIAAACVIVVSGLSDCVDGYIARKLHQESELGKILDPIADKLTLLAAGICLIVIEPYIMPVMIILVIKDIIMLIGGTTLIRCGIVPPKSKWYGKLGTLCFYVSVTAIVLMEVLNYRNECLSIILLSVTAAVMAFALIKYYCIYVELMKSHNVVTPAQSEALTDGNDDNNHKGENI